MNLERLQALLGYFLKPIKTKFICEQGQDRVKGMGLIWDVFSYYFRCFLTDAIGYSNIFISKVDLFKHSR